MNDFEEVLHGRQLACRILESLKNRPEYNNFLPVIEEVNRNLPNRDIPDHYIACFSREKDSLDLWRGYCPTGGVAIEFDLNIRNPFLAMPVLNLVDALYSNIQKTKIILAVIRKFHDEYKKDLTHYSNKLPDDHNIEYVKHLISSLEFHFLRFKHPAFINEHEVRLINSGLPKNFYEKSFKPTTSFIVPYFCTSKLITKDTDGNQIAIEPLPITSIIIGPSSQQGLTAKSVENFIKFQGYADIQIALSEVPLRYV